MKNLENVIESDIPVGMLLAPNPIGSMVNFVKWKRGKLCSSHNNSSFNIECLWFSADGEEELYELLNGVVNEFGVKKIVWRSRSETYHNTEKFSSDLDGLCACVCYLIIDGEVNA